MYLYENGFGNKKPAVVDMPLNQNKQTNKQTVSNTWISSGLQTFAFFLIYDEFLQ